MSEWDACQGGAGDHLVRRLDLGSGFRAGRLADGRILLYLDDCFSMTVEVTSLSDGVLSLPGAEVCSGPSGEGGTTCSSTTRRRRGSPR